jgi:hypothetical protein
LSVFPLPLRIWPLFCNTASSMCIL